MIKRAAYGLLALLLIAIVVLYAGDGIHWDREAPYQLVSSWGGKGSEAGKFNDPTGIAVTANEVFVADARNNRIQVFDKQGKFKRAFGEDRIGRPMNIAVAGHNLYVPDYFQDVIHVFTLNGDYQRALAAEDGFNSPGGVAIYPDGTLLVADTYAQRVVHLAADGRVLRSWGKPDGIDFSYPTDVAIAADGSFYVADAYNDRIQQFGSKGQLLRKWGGPFAINIFGPFKGWFATVTSIAVGADGSVFAADFYNDRVQKFTAEGKFLTAFGLPSTEAGHSEIAVAADAEGSVWSTNFAANRVEQWR